jgi:ELP3 family radical SAM enzyme/protein acetyltransferase
MYHKRTMLEIEDLCSDATSRRQTTLRGCVDFLTKQDISTEKEYSIAHRKMMRKYKISAKKSELLNVLQTEYDASERSVSNLRPYLIKKKKKSLSGVLVITVLTSPYPTDDKGKKQTFSCKWNCYYCPNEPGQPRSYLKDEPAVSRANRFDFCPKKQFNGRVSRLRDNGHPVDKIELLVLGGTWASYPKSYQLHFCRDLYYSANTFWDSEKREPYTIEEEQRINESARTKIIGLTLETRPDCINPTELRLFRKYGCTRVQLGVQHTSNDILQRINRGHDVNASIQGIEMLLNNCFKVDIHLMPDLPGSSFEKDREMFSTILYSSKFRADQLKIYPHSVVPWTVTKKWFEDGTFVPMSASDLMENILWFKTRVHPWIRLNRIIRDIPTQYISGGNMIPNLRQDMHKEMKRRGVSCDCIRCREIGDAVAECCERVVRSYRASHGTEYFISYEDTKNNKIIGFIRVRITKYAGAIRTSGKRTFIFPELKECALIRELHVYGKLIPTDQRKRTQTTQHTGLGRKLLTEAMNIALLHGRRRIAVIAGVGTRNYYRRYGFEHAGRGAYMVKSITCFEACRILVRKHYHIIIGLIVVGLAVHTYK